MNYRLLWHKTASKFLEKCSPKQKEMVKEKLEWLQSNPYKHPQLDIKIMQGYDDVYPLVAKNLAVQGEDVSGSISNFS